MDEEEVVSGFRMVPTAMRRVGGLPDDPELISMFPQIAQTATATEQVTHQCGNQQKKGGTTKQPHGESGHNQQD
jgi:hypothetical protein